MSRTLTRTSLILRILIAGLFIWSLFYKFTGAASAVYIFTTLGVEPWGRIATGIMELLASLLLLYPATVVYGARLSAGVLVGALASHLFLGLGVNVQFPYGADHGALFTQAVVMFLMSLALVWIHREEMPLLALRRNRVEWG